MARMDRYYKEEMDKFKNTRFFKIYRIIFFIIFISISIFVFLNTERENDKIREKALSFDKLDLNILIKEVIYKGDAGVMVISNKNYLDMSNYYIIPKEEYSIYFDTTTIYSVYSYKFELLELKPPYQLIKKANSDTVLCVKNNTKLYFIKYKS